MKSRIVNLLTFLSCNKLKNCNPGTRGSDAFQLYSAISNNAGLNLHTNIPYRERFKDNNNQFLKIKYVFSSTASNQDDPELYLLLLLKGK